ncbi:MAG TPA: FIST N-terminal domain-containing protein [Kofleriaceae bacterium]|nr:FIST N-terminal domain-containing protein [Kofleriaceae bacterium]
MRTEQRVYTHAHGWSAPAGRELASAQLVVVFARGDLLETPDLCGELRQSYPEARIVGCSTAGEIAGTRVLDGSLVATAIRFEWSHAEVAMVDMPSPGDCVEAGRALGRALRHDGLVHVFVLSEGLAVNGTDLARGLAASLPPGVAVTGGLSGDCERFERTLVLFGEDAKPGRIVAIGLYGSRLRFGFGSLGGWDPFGPVRRVTRSSGNQLFELDGRPALALYRQYLGEHAAQLPASALLFPLLVRPPDGDSEVVRTVLSINDADHSMTFAGDVVENAEARLMMANFDRLVDGAEGAASRAHSALSGGSADLALLVSCVGRKLVLKQRTEEEVEVVRDILGEGTCLAGFYSYGELCPTAPQASCELHNQTMTITTLAEA